jgi:hypothetical protein
MKGIEINRDGTPQRKLLVFDRELLMRGVNALLANSLPDEPQEHRAWVDNLPAFEGDEGLPGGTTWPREYLQDFARRERARRIKLRDGFAGFIAKQFAARFVKEMKQPSPRSEPDANL